MVAILLLAGLIMPPAVVPTIYVLQGIGLYKTLLGMILVEVALLMPFSVLIFRTFVPAIPRELDEAAIIDGASSWTLFFRVIFPLLRPAIITVDRRLVRGHLQRLRQPALLPAGRTTTPPSS